MSGNYNELTSKNNAITQGNIKLTQINNKIVQIDKDKASLKPDTKEFKELDQKRAGLVKEKNQKEQELKDLSGEIKKFEGSTFTKDLPLSAYVLEQNQFNKLPNDYSQFPIAVQYYPSRVPKTVPVVFETLSGSFTSYEQAEEQRKKIEEQYTKTTTTYYYQDQNGYVQIDSDALMSFKKNADHSGLTKNFNKNVELIEKNNNTISKLKSQMQAQQKKQNSNENTIFKLSGEIDALNLQNRQIQKKNLTIANLTARY